MKKTLLFVLLLGVSVASYTQHASKEDETALLAINRQFIRNFLTNDTIAHNKIIHPSNFLFIGTNGQLHNRNEYMQAWATGYDKTAMPEFDLGEVQVRVFDNMALIVAKTRDKTMKNGEWAMGETRYTDTYIKEKGEWKCVQVQLTRIAN